MKVSVVITSYNQKEYLIQTIDSVLAQTVKPDEIIICDDLSSDGSRDVIKKYLSDYPNIVKPIFQPKNLGVTRNRNSGIRAAKGDFITTLDGDDLYLPEKLEKELEVASNSSAELIYSNVIYIDETGRKTGIRYKNNKQLQGCLFEKIAVLKYPAPREVLIKRSCVEELGCLDELFPINEDFEWIVRLASRYPFAAVKTPLVKHRFHPKGLHQSGRLLLLETLEAVTLKMITHCDTSIEQDKESSKKRIVAFLNLTKARIEAHKGNFSQAGKFLKQSIAQDWRRSSSYDLLMRLYMPKYFKRQHRVSDPLMIGPLAVPFYLARGVL